jgi:tetratricopeptide (TPR) repeat protein
MIAVGQQVQTQLETLQRCQESGVTFDSSLCDQLLQKIHDDWTTSYAKDIFSRVLDLLDSILTCKIASPTTTDLSYSLLHKAIFLSQKQQKDFQEAIDVLVNAFSLSSNQHERIQLKWINLSDAETQSEVIRSNIQQYRSDLSSVYKKTQREAIQSALPLIRWISPLTSRIEPFYHDLETHVTELTQLIVSAMLSNGQTIPQWLMDSSLPQSTRIMIMCSSWETFEKQLVQPLLLLAMQKPYVLSLQDCEDFETNQQEMKQFKDLFDNVKMALEYDPLMKELFLEYLEQIYLETQNERVLYVWRLFARKEDILEQFEKVDEKSMNMLGKYTNKEHWFIIQASPQVLHDVIEYAITHSKQKSTLWHTCIRYVEFACSREWNVPDEQSQKLLINFISLVGLLQEKLPENLDDFFNEKLERMFDRSFVSSHVITLLLVIWCVSQMKQDRKGIGSKFLHRLVAYVIGQSGPPGEPGFEQLFYLFDILNHLREQDKKIQSEKDLIISKLNSIS